MATDINLQVLTSAGCHNCEAFKSFWEGEKSNWPNVTFTELDLLTPEGQEVVQRHQIMASPGVLLNDELFSTGGVNKEQFLAKLKELSGG